MAAILANFMENIVRSSTNDCWVWAGRTTRGGGSEQPRFRYRDGGTRRVEVSARHWILEFALGEQLPKWCRTGDTCGDEMCVNPDHLFVKERKTAVAMKREFRDAAKAVPCADCGAQYPPYVMDFDHRPEHDKDFEISKSGNCSLDELAAEIAKCDVVCANCHRERTHQRGYSNQFF